MSRLRTVALDNTFNVKFLTGLEKFVKTVKSKCETIFKKFESFRDVVSNNKILHTTRFWVNWAFLIALEVLKPSRYARVLILSLAQLEKPNLHRNSSSSGRKSRLCISLEILQIQGVEMSTVRSFFTIYLSIITRNI
jgi:hypothetical protein